MKTKLFYTAPASNIYEVRLEGMVAVSLSDQGTENSGYDNPDDL
jgi:hypothetical protein